MGASVGRFPNFAHGPRRRAVLTPWLPLPSGEGGRRERKVARYASPIEETVGDGGASPRFSADASDGRCRAGSRAGEARGIDRAGERACRAATGWRDSVAAGDQTPQECAARVAEQDPAVSARRGQSGGE